MLCPFFRSVSTRKNLVLGWTWLMAIKIVKYRSAPLWGEAEWVGLVQRGEGMALGGPNIPGHTWGNNAEMSRLVVGWHWKMSMSNQVLCPQDWEVGDKLYTLMDWTMAKICCGSFLSQWLIIWGEYSYSTTSENFCEYPAELSFDWICQKIPIQIPYRNKFH